jgi:cytochrome c-type biogenesis protein CcmF
MEGLMRKPYIRRNLFFDLYLAPEQIQNDQEMPGLKLKKGKSVELGGYSITFREFQSSEHSGSESMKFGAVLDITDSTGATETIVPAIGLEGGSMKNYETPLMKGREEHPVRLEKILADQGEVIVSIAGLTDNKASDLLIMEVSKKPTMNVLWGGSIILILGGLLSVFRRWKIASSA